MPVSLYAPARFNAAFMCVTPDHLCGTPPAGESSATQPPHFTRRGPQVGKGFPKVTFTHSFAIYAQGTFPVCRAPAECWSPRSEHPRARGGYAPGPPTQSSAPPHLAEGVFITPVHTPPCPQGDSGPQRCRDVFSLE